MNAEIDIIAKKMVASGRNIVFTGAGISTESGIPDYRSQGGLWDKFKPVYFDEFMSSRASRIAYWEKWHTLYPDLMAARPNKGHEAVTGLYEMGLVKTVVTQNIDGLHQESGLPDDAVIELHGNTRRIRCMTCSEISPIEDARKRIDDGDPAPECHCGGFLKPDTISFGQSMPMDKVNRALELSQKSDFFMVIGSTLVVQPAAHMPVYAKQNGAFLAIVNLSETPCDTMSDVLIQEKAGDALQAIYQKARELQSKE
ncbi:MAG: Sir2 family NAD-dependent protein deacetylase [Thermodesulfobacteriota bacterium]